MRVHTVNCVKNPGHEQFMSVSDFIDSLSCVDSQGDLDREWFRVTADLTVKLFVCHTSQDRLDGYPFCQCRGSSFPRVGTGWIHRVYSEINKPCPCDKCNGQEVRSSGGSMYGQLNMSCMTRRRRRKHDLICFTMMKHPTRMGRLYLCRR